MAVRSRKFAGPVQLLGPGALTLLYTVPADRTLRISAVIGRNGGPGTTRWRIAIKDTAGYLYVWEDDIGEGRSTTCLGGTVLMPGAEFRADASQPGAVTLYGSGSLLGGAPS